MVSPFTLGLFAPLPLAMMIPFMATQSLAMGEAFGKSFQYGKRKISSMTNEEFNKLTFNDLMDQQTANIKSIIPKLHEQMTDSYQMQTDIFREMTKLLPAALEALAIEAKRLADKSSDSTRGGGTELPFGGLNPGSSQLVPASHETTSQATQQQTTIINTSHDGKSTIETPSAPKQPSVQDARIQFRNKISNWNRNTVTQAFKAGSSLYEPWQLQLLQEQLDKINKFENPVSKTPVPKQTPLTKQELAQKAYLSSTVTRENELILSRQTLRNAQNRLDDNRTQANINAVTTTAAKIKRQEQAFINYITRSRNNILLKSVANRDWNDRIWK